MLWLFNLDLFMKLVKDTLIHNILEFQKKRKRFDGSNLSFSVMYVLDETVEVPEASWSCIN